MNTFLQFNSATMMFMDEQKKQEDQIDVNVRDKGQQISYSTKKAANYVKLVEEGKIKEDNKQSDK